MNKKKLTATILSTAIGISTVIPAGIPEITTYADAPITSADANNKLGDVNNDDAVDANDSSIVLEEYSLLSTGKDSNLSDKQKKAADVDKNGEIDASDATIILSYYSYVSTGGKLDIEQFIEVIFGNPVDSTTTTTATTTNTTTTASSTTANTTTTASKTTANTTTTASKTTANTTTTASKTTANTTTTASKTTANTTTTASSTTANTTTTASSTTANTTTTASKTTANTTTTASSTTANTTTTASSTTANTSTTASSTTANTTTTTSNPTTTSTITSTTIANPDKVSEIILNRNEINMGIGESERITDIKVIPQNAVNQEMKWTSSDDSIAIVNNLGWIIGKKAGQCKIVIQSVDNPNAFAVIIVNVTDGESTTTSTSTETTSTTTETTTVSTTTETTTTTTATTNIKVTGISVTKNSVTLSVGGRDIPFVTMYPENASDKGEIWVSSDENIATVDKYGWIVGKSVGECKVTVYSVSDPSVYAEIEVKVVDEDVPVPEFNFSYVLGDKSDAKNLVFYTPIPKDASGRFGIDYVITDANGKVTKMSYAIFAPEMNSIVAPLTAETNNFTVNTYITNLETNDTAKIGTYEFSLVPRDAKTIIEDIHYAFYIINGLTK